MKFLRISTAVASLLISAPLTSCQNYRTPEQNAAATGGLIGAGAGAILADDSAEGAVLGGAIGAGSGYLYEKHKHH